MDDKFNQGNNINVSLLIIFKNKNIIYFICFREAILNEDRFSKSKIIELIYSDITKQY
jgi:hypothetical protein